MDQASIDAIFTPRKIAIIGASSDPTKTSYRPLKYLVENGYPGRIFPVNPRAVEVCGHKAWPSVEALPETPDLAFILLPTEPAIEAVAACGAKGIKAAVVLASGFSDAGSEGKAREARLMQAARETGLRLIGPSSIGLANLHERLVLTGNAAFAEAGHRPGGIFCASQSGSMIGALLSRGKAKGIGFAGLVSVGGEVDLSLGALCEVTLDDPRVTSYMLFLETLRDVQGLRRFAVGAAERGKPIVALKIGRSKAAAEIALTHTGALAGEDDVAEAFLADCGIARVETLEALLEAASLLRRLPIRGNRKRKPAVGVLTTTGGGAALVVDQLGVRGVSVEKPDEETLSAIRRVNPDTAPGRIVDLTLTGVRYDVMRGALDAMLASPSFDLVIATVGSSARFQPELAVKPIVDTAATQDRLAAFIVPEAPEALAMLAENGVPCFRTPEACADAVAAALARRPPRPLDLPPAAAGSGRTTLNEHEGYALLSKLGIGHAPAAAIPVEGGAVDASLYPAVVKVLHRDILHKTDVGGVVFDVTSDAELKQAAARITAAIAERRPDTAVSHLLVQKMIRGAVGEALIGYRVDAQVGPLVILAAGGVATEIYRDRCVRMAPVDIETAYEMIDDVRGMIALRGFRGRPEGDVLALAEAIIAVSSLARQPDIAELEINPLLVMPRGEGVLAVDVVVRQNV